MRDGPIALARVLAGQGDDGAGRLGAVERRGTGARSIGQALGNPRPFGREPTAPPVSHRCTRNAEVFGTRSDPDALIGEQNDPRTQREVLRTGLLADQRLEMATLALTQVNRFGFVGRHCWLGSC